MDIPIENAQLISESYIETILTDDAQRIDGIKYDIDKMRLCCGLLREMKAQQLPRKNVENDIKDIDDESLDYDTVGKYLDVFERLFLLIIKSRSHRISALRYV
ncbi:MAG: hypothetical protein ACLSA6_16650 [Holdemania massiliensis]